MYRDRDDGEYEAIVGVNHMMPIQPTWLGRRTIRYGTGTLNSKAGTAELKEP